MGWEGCRLAGDHLIMAGTDGPKQRPREQGWKEGET